MKMVVFAYHNIGYECLKLLLESGDEVVAVVTHQDDPNENIWFRSVAELARTHQLPVYTPYSPNTPTFLSQVRRLEPELIFSFYYRRLLSEELLHIAPKGGINLHGSLLPKYRGRCPVNWVLINGETESGVTLHNMIKEADAGDIIAQQAVTIDVEETVLSLFNKLTSASTQLLKKVLPSIRAGTVNRIPQDSHQATTFGGRRPVDGRIQWKSSVLSIHNLIRAVTHPYPGAFTFLNGRKLYIWEATVNHQFPMRREGQPGTIDGIKNNKGIGVLTGEGTLLVKRVQFEGEEETSANNLMERHSIPVGCCLG